MRSANLLLLTLMKVIRFILFSPEAQVDREAPSRY